MKAQLAAEASGAGQDATPGPALMGRFHVAALVMQRARQLANGARPRIEPEGHKHLRIAEGEVMAGTISWSFAPVGEPAPETS